MSEKIAPVEMPVITEPKLSIDRITLLMQTGPRLGFAGVGDPKYNRKRSKAVNDMIQLLRKGHRDCFDSTPCSAETELYMYHYRLQGGIDLQMCPRFGIKSRQTDPGYVMAFCDPYEQALFEENGFVDEYFDSDYCVRLEWNPSKDDINASAPLLSTIANQICDPDLFFDDLFKISRIDIAVDYPEALNPALFSSNARKGNCFFGSQGVETMYFGSRRSPAHWRIYDKKLEYLEKDNIEYAGSHLWRIELESKPAISIGQDLNFYSEIFSRLEYFYGKSTGDYKYDWFLNYAKQYGIQTALKTIPDPKTRKKFKTVFINLDFDAIKHPKHIVGWQFPKLWRVFYDNLKCICNRESDPAIYARNIKETL